jgi:hypothetical protein
VNVPFSGVVLRSSKVGARQAALLQRVKLSMDATREKMSFAPYISNFKAAAHQTSAGFSIWGRLMTTTAPESFSYSHDPNHTHHLRVSSDLI